MLKTISLIRLFFIYVKIGTILLGGGFVILPIITSEFCEKRKLIDNDEIVDYFALSQSLPGIIAANMSVFIGYKLRGVLGAVVAMAGIVFVPFWTIILLAFCINSFVNNDLVQSIFWGVGIGVIALITLTVKEIFQKSKKDLFFYLIFLLTICSLLFLKLSPVQVIVIYTILGIIFKHFFCSKEGSKL